MLPMPASTRNQRAMVPGPGNTNRSCGGSYYPSVGLSIYGSTGDGKFVLGQTVTVSSFT